ncbi:MAG: hypothetical protein GY788_03495 [bacterium]|nr:hypothetical protein [bacterium]
MDELEQNPEFVERQRLRMAERDESRRRYHQAASGLLADLRAAGFDVDVVSELKEAGDSRAVPVLVRWLPRVDYLPLKRDIIATLGSRWGRPDAARPLIEEFHRTLPPADLSETGLRWFIGDALERVADESVLNELIEIASDVGLGRDRSLVVAALGNVPGAADRVVPVLIELLDDSVVAGYAAMAVGKLGAIEARPKLQELAVHREKWVRDEASKALARVSG